MNGSTVVQTVLVLIGKHLFDETTYKIRLIRVYRLHKSVHHDKRYELFNASSACSVDVIRCDEIVAEME